MLFAGILWCASIVTGVAWLFEYDDRDARSSPSPIHWPVESALTRPEGKPGLLLFLHPKCPCSRATLTELETIVTHTHGHLAVSVVVLQLTNAPSDWTPASLIGWLGSIPGVAIHRDFDGVEARRFGAQTSGFVTVYDERGTLEFSGGITGSRGHIGDNDGRRAVIAIAERKPAHLKQTPVFGCSLVTPPEGGFSE